MKSKRLVVALGLVALLLVAGSIAGCSQAPSGNSTNPMEDITNPDNTQPKMPVQAAGLPEESPAAGGTIEKIAGNTFDLRQEMIAIPSGQTETKIWQVIFSPSTKVLRPVFHLGEGEPAPPEELSVYDLEEGQSVDVYGEVEGERIFAHTIVVWTGGKLK